MAVNHLTLKLMGGEDEDPTLCVAKLELLGPDLLAANDNGRCGGANISFGGVYKRAR